LPFRDQWAELLVIYRPHVHPLDWFAFHNEHRIVLSRITAFVLFIVTGRWDPMVQMLFNAALHAATAGMLVFVLVRTLQPLHAGVVAVFAALMVAVPLGWENTLGAFQVQFYGVILLGLVSVLMSCRAPAFGASWLGGLALGVLAYFAMASGALTLLGLAAIAGVQLIAGQRAGRKEYAGAALQLAIAIVLIADATTRIGPTATPRSLAGLLQDFALMAAWPVSTSPLGADVSLVAMLLVQAPAAWLIGRLLIERPPIGDRRWLYVALVLWVMLQAGAIAIGRSGIGSRFVDIFIVGTIVNLACLFDLLARQPTVRVKACFAAWLIVIALAVAKGATSIGYDIAARIAAPDRFASVVREALDDPAVRDTFPAAISGRAEPPALRLFKKNVLHLGPSLIAIAIALFMLLAAAGERRTEPRHHKD
jgi:hypothetical protein